LGNLQRGVGDKMVRENSPLGKSTLYALQKPDVSKGGGEKQFVVCALQDINGEMGKTTS